MREAELYRGQMMDIPRLDQKMLFNLHYEIALMIPETRKAVGM